MYLRMGWVVANVGLTATILIVTLSSFITFLTALSIASTATNMRVGGGGSYYMISRSFGIEAGAAIGIPLFLAMAIGISFYVAGFAESVHVLLPDIPQVWISTVTLIVLTLLAHRSANLALTIQVGIFVIIVASLISFFMGEPVDGLAESSLPRVPFWAVFAVFFPAVTGIQSGLAMSGELKNPARALPLGTMAAIGTGFVVYLAIPTWLSEMAPMGALAEDTLIMRKIAAVGPLILLGIWGATLSSALGLVLGAARTLQALARDRVVFRILGQGDKTHDNPQIATVVSFAIALTAILLGDFNSIAGILTMFFLTAYGFLNLAAGLESFLGNPSWRPTFRTPWPLSIMGAIGCGLVMLMINAGATIIATVCVVGLFWITKRRKLGTRWSDIRRGLIMSAIRYGLYKLVHQEPDVRSWRPNVLALSGNPTSRWYLIELAGALTEGQGILSVGAIIPPTKDRERAGQVVRSAREFLWKKGVPALVEIRTDENVMTGVNALIKNYGMGPLKPNTILLGETEKAQHFAAYSDLIQEVFHLKKNVVIVRQGTRKGADIPTPPKWSWQKKRPRIDVWWGRERQNANFMLALAYLLQISSRWEDAEIVLKTSVNDGDDRASAMKTLREFVARSRLEVTPEVVLLDPSDNVFHQITEESKNADLVFLGLKSPDPEETPEQYAHYYSGLLAKTSGLPTTLIVLAAEEVKFGEIFT